MLTISKPANDPIHNQRFIAESFWAQSEAADFLCGRQLFARLSDDAASGAGCLVLSLFRTQACLGTHNQCDPKREVKIVRLEPTQVTQPLLAIRETRVARGAENMVTTRL